MILLDGPASAGGMDSPLPILSLSAAALAGAAVTFPKLQARLALSRAKHRSLTRTFEDVAPGRAPDPVL